LIAGGGLAGLSCAYHLKGPRILIDREKEPGGTARSVAQDGFTFDYTGHLLHLHDAYTRRLVRRLLGSNVIHCRRDAWIHSHGVYTRYPFQANLYGLPRRVVAECLKGLREAHAVHGDGPVEATADLNFRDWCLRLFGRGISRHFMFPYNHKLWRTPPAGMTAQWCGRFVPRPRWEDVAAGARRDNTRAYGYNTTFLYPKKGGIQVLARALARGVPDLRLGVSLEEVDWKRRRARLGSGAWVDYRRLVSTLPLPELVRRLRPFPPVLEAPLKSLRWTSVLCVNLGVDRAGVSEKSWIYFPEKKFVFYRAGFPMNFTPHAAPPGCSSLYVETSFPPGRLPRTDSAKARLLGRVREGLEEAGLLRPDDRFRTVGFLPIPYAYVIYDRSRSEAVEGILSWLGSRGISSIGRYGAWKYSFMEEAILDGKKTAELLTYV
jgi:protoporphyrinogen oxidase